MASLMKFSAIVYVVIATLVKRCSASGFCHETFVEGFTCYYRAFYYVRCGWFDTCTRTRTASKTCYRTSIRIVCCPGFQGSHCTDIDECSTNNGECEHGCSNIAGSHTCSCLPGYELNNDNKTCSDVDECLSNTDRCGDHNCTNANGSYTCSCLPGYRLAEDGKHCTHSSSTDQPKDMKILIILLVIPAVVCFLCAIRKIKGKRLRVSDVNNDKNNSTSSGPFDLLLVVDANDLIMLNTECLMTALRSLVPKPYIRRTTVHRLFMEFEPIVCQRAFFFICQEYTSPADCINKLFSRIKLINGGNIVIYSTDSRMASSEMVVCNTQTDANGINNYSVSLTQPIGDMWFIYFVKMFYVNYISTNLSFIVTTPFPLHADGTRVTNAIKECLGAFGFQPVILGDKKTIEIIILNDLSDSEVDLPDKKSKNKFIFLNTIAGIPSAGITKAGFSNIYMKGEEMKLLLCVLNRAKVIISETIVR